MKRPSFTRPGFAGSTHSIDAGRARQTSKLSAFGSCGVCSSSSACRRRPPTRIQLLERLKELNDAPREARLVEGDHPFLIGLAADLGGGPDAAGLDHLGRGEPAQAVGHRRVSLVGDERRAVLPAELAGHEVARSRRRKGCRRSRSLRRGMPPRARSPRAPCRVRPRSGQQTAQPARAASATRESGCRR